MKYLLIAALVTVATAAPKPKQLVNPGAAGPAPVIPEPVAIGPAIIDQFEPVSIGPAIIDTPIAPAPIENPAVAAPAPLVQIILNINSPNAPVSPGIVNPQPPRPEPAPVEGITPGVPVSPVQVVDIPPSPVQVVDNPPVAVDPVIIGTPVLPLPAVVLPEELN